MENEKKPFRKVLLPLLALAVGALGALLIYQGNLARERILTQTVTVVTVKSRIEAGEVLSGQKLSRTALPAAFCPSGAP